MRIIRQSLHILLDAFYRFDRDDGWAIASHIALSILMSVSVVTAIAADVGYNVFRDRNYKVGPFVGYSYFRQMTNGFGCTQLTTPRCGSVCRPS